MKMVKICLVFSVQTHCIASLCSWRPEPIAEPIPLSLVNDLLSDTVQIKVENPLKYNKINNEI